MNSYFELIESICFRGQKHCGSAGCTEGFRYHIEPALGFWSLNKMNPCI